MNYLRSLSNRSSTWAFLAGASLLPALAAVRDAFNSPSGFYAFNAFALCAAFATFAGYWISHTRAEMRHKAEEAAMYTETLPAAATARYRH